MAESRYRVDEWFGVRVPVEISALSKWTHMVAANMASVDIYVMADLLGDGIPWR